MPEENLEEILKGFGQKIQGVESGLEQVAGKQRQTQEELTGMRRGLAQAAGGERAPGGGLTQAVADYVGSDVTYNNVFIDRDLMGAGILDLVFDSVPELFGALTGGFKAYETPEELQEAWDRVAEYEARIKVGEDRKDKMKVMEETLSNLIEDYSNLKKTIVSKQLQENFQENQELNGGFKAYETPEEGEEKIRETLKYEPEELGGREKAYEGNIGKIFEIGVEHLKEGKEEQIDFMNSYLNTVNKMTGNTIETLSEFYRKRN